MPYFLRLPDTSFDIEFKIKNLQTNIDALQLSLDNMKRDLLKNHLTYSASLIERKQSMMAETQSSIKRKKHQIDNYTEKLKILKK